tara:strand:- start:302 stop:3658 length:3357 start_codon:yes stop_codon:yes gene_type:complete
MSEGLEETIVVECSRQSSLEGTTFNKENLAEWTNDCGAGIVLDIGDKIQVHSGFVSEKGAQAGEIEIKERDRKNIVKLLVSNDIEYKDPFPTYLPSISNEFVAASAEVYEYATEIGGNSIVNIPINDGETNFVYSPYKTANGEFYATLPRRHVGCNAYAAGLGDVAPVANEYTVFDSNDGAFLSGFNNGAGYTGNVKYGNLSGSKPEFLFGFNDAWQFNPSDFKYVIQNKTVVNPQTAANKFVNRKGMILNDNSRYTLFRLETVYRTSAAALARGGNTRATIGGTATDASAHNVGTAEFQDAKDLRDPAVLGTWHQVRELVKITSKTGFNKPEDVATELTQQLNLRGEAQETDINFRLTGPGAYYVDKPLYKNYDSPCYRSYNCANNNWNSQAWYAFRDVKAGNLDEALTYMAQYQHIGIKRPELHIQGRATNASQGFLKSSTDANTNDTPHNAQVLNLGIVWNDDNLNNLNELFKIQAKYPELFTGVTQHGPHSENPKVNHDINAQGPNHHRFLHFNRQDEGVTDTENTAGIRRHNPKNCLGYDLYGQDSDEAIPKNPPTSNAQYHYSHQMATYPVFFDFNPDTIDLRPQDVGFTEDGAASVADIKQLTYGWARQIRTGDNLYIGIQFSYTGNGVPEFLYNGNTHIAKNVAGNTGRRFGWDYHFSAYGNPCMILYSGMVSNQTDAIVGDEKQHFQVSATCDDLNAVSARVVGAKYHTIQLGADGPAIGFDENEERFFLSNLHISEKLGNPNDAGAIEIRTEATQSKPESVVTTAAVLANSNADTPVYKINKRMLGNSYCPNVAPYPISLAIPSEGIYPTQQIFSNNLEADTPYDAQGGMFIEEVGVPEDIWDDNLIGVLGFSYDQFNNTDITRQTTIRDRFNSTNLKSLTTQAPISVEDLLRWNKNGFGNNSFGLTPAPVYMRNAGTHKVEGIYPPATIILEEARDSTRITAVELPTKTARPYYAIRSDILPQSQFLGGNGDHVLATAAAVNRPVVGIVNKINGYGDFYSTSEQQLVFTNTVKRVITSIKTSIHDPDGSFSKVNKSSSVIYKIMKQKQVDLTPVQTLLESKNKKQQEDGDLAASMIKDPANANPNYSQTFNFKPINQEEFFAARSSE